MERERQRSNITLRLEYLQEDKEGDCFVGVENGSDYEEMSNNRDWIVTRQDEWVGALQWTLSMDFFLDPQEDLMFSIHAIALNLASERYAPFPSLNFSPQDSNVRSYNLIWKVALVFLCGRN